MIFRNYRIPSEGRSRYKNKNTASNFYSYREVVKEVNKVAAASTASVQSLTKAAAATNAANAATIQKLTTDLETVTEDARKLKQDFLALDERYPRESELEPQEEAVP